MPVVEKPPSDELEHLDRIYRARHVADYLDVKVYTVREWIKAGKLRASKVGKSYIIKEDDLRAFVSARYGPPEERGEAVQPGIHRGEVPDGGDGGGGD